MTVRRRWAAVAVGFAAVVLAASLVPASAGGGSLLAGTDKLLHAVGYAAVAFAAANAPEAPTDRTLVGVVVAVAAFGAGVEVVQPVVGRAASLGDAVANLAGAALGALAVRVSRSR